jgi:ribose transport system permease protein
MDDAHSPRAAPEGHPGPIRSGSRGTRALRGLLFHPEITVLVVTLLLSAYLAITSEFFLQKTNLLNISEAVSVIGIAAAFATLVVITGGLDLTPATVFVISGIVVIETLDAGAPAAVAILAGMLTGGAIGALNGVLIARFDLNPVIVTLGTNFLFTGLAFVITNGQGQLITNQGFLEFWSSDVPGGIPVITVVMVCVFAIAFVILRFSRFGIHVYAIGGDPVAARLNGVNVVAVRLAVYTLAGLAAGLAGVVSAGISGSVAAFGALSQTDLLKIIAAIIIGGTSLAGGRGNVYGTFIGVLLFGIIANGLVLKDISTFYQPVVIGAVMLSAVLLERVRNRLALEP